MDELTRKLAGPVSRRRLLTTAAAAGAGTALIGPGGEQLLAQEEAQLREVPRNRTLIHGITGNQLTDYNTFNPFLPGIATATGYPFCFEPLFYYNSYFTESTCGPDAMECEEGVVPWIGTRYEYNADFTGVTMYLRDGVAWGDGTPFTANDIVFTVNMLKSNAPQLVWSIDMQTWVADVTAPDDLTVAFTLNSANPRFMFQFFTFHFDRGIPIVPQHIWESQDPTTFTFLDLAQGWPVTTGPWNVVLSSPQQRIYDRRDDWWAASTNFHALPAPERIIVLPGSNETTMVQMAINNEVDLTIDLRPNNITAVMAQNPNVTTWTGGEPPYGYLDWWPIGLGFNCMREPYSDPEIRWAINHTIDRNQLVQFGYQGAGAPTLLPYPHFPALLTYVDSVPELTATIDAYNLARTDEIMQSKGYAKDGDGFWALDGQRFSMVIYSLILFQDIAPILVEQLRQGGFDASFNTIIGPEFSDSVYSGNIDAFILGHGGSVRDPYFTMLLYHSRYSLPTGERASQPYRWVNAEYDAIVDEMALTSQGDPRVLELFQQAMNIWIPDLPDIGLVQWFHRIPTNQTYWTNFPSAENPYINSAYWHRTAPLWINTIQPTQ